MHHECVRVTTAIAHLAGRWVTSQGHWRLWGTSAWQGASSCVLHGLSGEDRSPVASGCFLRNRMSRAAMLRVDQLASQSASHP